MMQVRMDAGNVCGYRLFVTWVLCGVAIILGQQMLPAAWRLSSATAAAAVVGAVRLCLLPDQTAQGTGAAAAMQLQHARAAGRIVVHDASSPGGARQAPSILTLTPYSG